MYNNQNDKNTMGNNFTLRKGIVTMVALAAFVSASAQEAGGSWQDNLVGRMEFGVGSQNKDVTPLAGDVQIGYKLLPRLAAFVDYEASVMLADAGGGKTYGRTTNLGGGLGFTFCKGMELRAKMAASVGHVDLKQTVYDVNVRLFWADWKVSPYVSLGYRHVSSHTAGVDNYNGFFGSFGFGI